MMIRNSSAAAAALEAEQRQPMVGFRGQRFAGFVPSTYDASTRSIEAVLSSGTAVRRMFFTEELEISARAVELTRARSGLVCLLDSHNQFELCAVLGTVGAVRIEGGRLVGRLFFGDTPRAREAEQMVVRGELRGVSIGYKVLSWDISKTGQDDHETWRATRWELMEVSLVSVPADASAGVRSAAANSTSNEDDDMLTRDDPAATPTTPPAPPQPSAASENRAATNQELRFLVEQTAGFGLGAEERAELFVRLAGDGLTPDQASRTILSICAERQRQSTYNISFGGSGVEARTMDNPAFYSRAIEDALYARMSGSAPSDAARQFMGMSMVQMAADMLARSGVRDAHRMSPTDVLDAAAGVGRRSSLHGSSARSGPYMTTSDFPSLLTGAGQRYLLDVFEAAGSAIKLLSRQRTANDFRAISGLQLSGFGTLPKVLEDGEVKSGAFTERKETYRLETFAKTFGLSRQAIINDDLGAFSSPMLIMGRSAAETEAQLFAALLNSNPALSDGTALFHADHGNLAASGAAPAVATLSAARLAMRSQKDADGVTPLAAAPKFVLASPARETEIETLLVAQTVPTTSDDANPFSGKLTPLIDPRLTGFAWYLFAEPAAAPVLEHAYLNGREGPEVATREGWNVLGVEFRVVMDFGADIVDHRGAYKNPGA